MTTQPPTPPANGVRTVRDALAALEVSPDLKQDFFDGVAAVDIAIDDPIPTYTVGLDDINAGKLTAAAVLTHWRYLLSATKPWRPLATADVGYHDTTWVLAGVNRGMIATSTAEAVAYARTTPLWKTGDVELRILQVPALYTVLVWLHGATETFLPIFAPEQALKPRAMLDEAAVLTVLRDLASHYMPVRP
jgi:hypothetical protein